MKKTVVNIRQSYSEQTIPITGDPLLIAGLLAESSLSETYLIYEDNGEWSIGIGVAELLTADAGKTCLQINGRSYSWQSELLSDSVKTALESLSIDQWRAYGIVNFELACHNYNLPCLSKDEPVLRLFIPRFEVRLREGSALLRALDKDKLQELIELVTSIDSSTGAVGAKTPFDLRIAEHKLEVPEIYTYETDVYQQAVASAVNEIRAQQYQKVIISRTIPLSKEIDIVASYIAGRRANTPARSFLLSLDNLKAAGFSPETVVEVTKEGWVSTRPLAGTRSIGCNAEEEIKLREELLHNSKEIHEHAISVKLAFEELCSVCSAESIGVCDFMSVCRRGTVQHLASRVKGRLKDGYNAWHAFTALFPAVSVTGIPKQESIDAIGRFESQPRNLYSGCVMIVDSDGAMDAALVLRSVFQKNKKAWLHVGAGIVDMSIPAREAEETCEKIRSISQHLVYLNRS
jgi:salicylate synthase